MGAIIVSLSDVVEQTSYFIHALLKCTCLHGNRSTKGLTSDINDCADLVQVSTFDF